MYSIHVEPTLPAHFSDPPIRISEETGGVDTYVVEQNDNIIVAVYCFACRAAGLPFQQAQRKNHLLATGCQNLFVLYDCDKSRNCITLDLDGYFGSFLWFENNIYVADAGSIHCISEEGLVLWHTAGLGIDGVIINDIESGMIVGSGEWDPPGGWRDFVLKKETGAQLA